MSVMAGHRWHVVQTQPHAERKANAHLNRQGFDTYLPRYLKRRRHARRVEIVQAALFPGYLFVAIDMATQRWRCISSTVGVRRLVCDGDQPSVVPPRVIEALRSREDERGFVQLRRRPRFAVGQKIRIEEGAFADCLGLFEDMGDGERVTVLLDFFSRKVRVALDAEFVTAA